MLILFYYVNLNSNACFNSNYSVSQKKKKVFVLFELLSNRNNINENIPKFSLRFNVLTLKLCLFSFETLNWASLATDQYYMVDYLPLPSGP